MTTLNENAETDTKYKMRVHLKSGEEFVSATLTSEDVEYLDRFMDQINNRVTLQFKLQDGNDIYIPDPSNNILYLIIRNIENE